MLGLFLPCILGAGHIPKSQPFPAWGIAAHRGERLTKLMGGFGLFLALFFWIVWEHRPFERGPGLQAAHRDGSRKGRKLAKQDIRRVDYTALAIFVVWGIVFLTPSIVAVQLLIVAVSANIANFTMAFSAADYPPQEEGAPEGVPVADLEGSTAHRIRPFLRLLLQGLHP